MSPGEGQAPASVRGAGTTSQFQKVVLDPGMQIQSVRFIAKPTETRVENLLKIIEEFLSSLGPPAVLWRRLLGHHLSSLTLLVKGGLLRMRSLQIRLRSKWDFRDELLRIPWDPLCQEDLLMVVLGDSKTRGRRSFPPSARLELLLGRVRRRLGRHRRETKCQELDSKPKGILHQPQGDDGSAERPIRV